MCVKNYSNINCFLTMKYKEFLILIWLDGSNRNSSEFLGLVAIDRVVIRQNQMWNNQYNPRYPLFFTEMDLSKIDLVDILAGLKPGFISYSKNWFNNTVHPNFMRYSILSNYLFL